MGLFRFEIANLRFGEFDLGGVLYHANYLHVYEMAREAFLSAGPMSYATLVNLRCHLAVVESRHRFMKPIKYGEKFTVDLTCSAIKRATLDLQYRFWRENLEVHRGVTSMVFVRAEGTDLSVEPMPAALKGYFEAYVGEPIF